MKPISHRRAFTLLEIVVILGIIALFLALLVPFAVRAREGGRSAACVKNMSVIGKAISSYTADNDGRLPGPLTMDQYPVDAAGTRDGQLLKYITPQLTSLGGARAAFTYPGWQKAQRATDSAVFLVNVEAVAPFEQPIWGDMAVKGKGPLKIEDVALVKFQQGDKEVKAKPSEVWALTEADQMLARNLGVTKADAWMLRLPEKAVHVSHRNALFFDWHVDRLTLTNSSIAPPTAD